MGLDEYWVWLEVATRGGLYKKMILKLSQNPQENACIRVSFLIKL